jgi:hypothetical protein
MQTLPINGNVSSCEHRAHCAHATVRTDTHCQTLTHIAAHDCRTLPHITACALAHKAACTTTAHCHTLPHNRTLPPTLLSALPRALRAHYRAHCHTLQTPCCTPPHCRAASHYCHAHNYTLLCALPYTNTHCRALSHALRVRIPRRPTSASGRSFASVFEQEQTGMASDMG